MKKGTALLVMVLILIISVIPAAGEGIFVSSESGDKIRILEDTDIMDPVNGNVISVLGNVTVNNKVNGHVIAVFGESTINAEVSGQVVTIFGNTNLRESAVVMGDIITIGSITKYTGATILGQEVRILGESMNLDIGAIVYLRLVVMILFTLAVLIVGMLAMLISKSSYNEMSKNIEKNFGRKMLLGILSFMGASALLLLLLVTLIAPLLYILVLILATIPACLYFGRFILKTFSPKNSIYMEFITGLFSITLVKLLAIFLVPQHRIIIGLILVGLVDLFIYSIGLGIHMEQHYLKGNESKSK